MNLKAVYQCWIWSALALVAFAGIAGAQSYQPGVGFAIVGIAAGETARVNALNLGIGSLPGPSGCTVTLQFLDAEGQLLQQRVVTLTAGRAAFLDVRRDGLPGGDRAQVRALLLFGYFGGANPGPDVLQRFDCNIVPSLEIIDDRTARTTVILTDTKPLPSPPPAQ